MSTSGKLLMGEGAAVVDPEPQDEPLLVNALESRSKAQAQALTSASGEPDIQRRPQRGAAGQVLNAKYALVREIGHGAMGSVWLAQHLGWNAPVAVKVMSPPETDIARERFEREVRLAATLRGPHVVQLLDHGVDTESGNPFIVMELLEGESLADRLRRLGRLSSREVFSVVADVGRALTRAHGAGIVHRDLKPANIFLVENGEMPLAKVLDFGIAKWVDNSLSKALTVEGRAVGTPWYMSPEQLKGLPIEPRADLWSLAIIAFEALTGRRPFEEYDIESITRVLCGRPRPIPSMLGPVPRGFDEWFARATAYDTAERFPSVHQLVDALRDVCASSPPERIEPVVSQRHSATIDSPSTPPLSRSHELVPAGAFRRHRVLVASLLAVLLLSMVANLLFFAQRDKRFATDPAREIPQPTTSAPSSVSFAIQPAAATASPPSVALPKSLAAPAPSEAGPPLPAGIAQDLPNSPAEAVPDAQPQLKVSPPKRPRKKVTTAPPPETMDDMGTDGERIYRRRL